MEKVQLSEIKEFIQIRSLKEWGVEHLVEKIKRLGFLPNFPVLISRDANGQVTLIDGNHRVEAARRLGMEEIFAHQVQDELSRNDMLKAAVAANEAAETMVKTSFVDHAEFVWRLGGEGLTQAQIADVLGWSRGKVSQYALLQKIDGEAWQGVATTFENCRSSETEEGVAEVATSVATPFSENLLRSIILLTSEQQKELVHGLAVGELTKAKFKNLAERYNSRNQASKWVKEKLSGMGEAFVVRALAEVEKGVYDDEWKKAGEAGEKLKKLIASIKEEWEQKTSIHLVLGDFYTEVKNIPDESVDLVLTDPPYNISTDRVISLEGRSDISRDFGSWDKTERETFLAQVKVWAQEFRRVLKPTGSCYVFCSDEFSSHLRDIFATEGLIPRNALVWCKTNPGTQHVQTNFKNAFEIIRFFTKNQTGHTFNWQGENEMRNWLESPICQGNERIKGSKGETLHPTQKPEKVIRYLLEISSNRGDVIFDGFAGVGTVAKVAKDMGRKCVAIEQNDVFYSAAQRRLEQ